MTKSIQVDNIGLKHYQQEDENLLVRVGKRITKYLITDILIFVYPFKTDYN
jgi:hypothetical protein